MAGFKMKLMNFDPVWGKKSQESNNMERASGHPSAATGDACLNSNTLKAHYEQLSVEICTSFRRTIYDLQTYYKADIDKNLNDIWASLTGNFKVFLQNQESQQRNLLKGYCKHCAEQRRDCL